MKVHLLSGTKRTYCGMIRLQFKEGQTTNDPEECDCKGCQRSWSFWLHLPPKTPYPST